MREAEKTEMHLKQVCDSLTKLQQKHDDSTMAVAALRQDLVEADRKSAAAADQQRTEFALLQSQNAELEQGKVEIEKAAELQNAQLQSTITKLKQDIDEADKQAEAAERQKTDFEATIAELKPVAPLR